MKIDQNTTIWVVTEPTLAGDPYGAVWTTPGGIDARVVDFVNDILSDLPTGQPVAQSPGDPEWPLVSA